MLYFQSLNSLAGFNISEFLRSRQALGNKETLHASETKGCCIFGKESSRVGQKRYHSSHQKCSANRKTCSVIKLLPHASMYQPLFSRNFYSIFCLWEVSFASFCGLLKIHFALNETFLFVYFPTQPIFPPEAALCCRCTRISLRKEPSLSLLNANSLTLVPP